MSEEQVFFRSPDNRTYGGGGGRWGTPIGGESDGFYRVFEPSGLLHVGTEEDSEEDGS